MKNKHLNDRANLIGLWKLRSEELYKAGKCVWHSDVINHPNNSEKDERLILHLQYRPACLLMGLSLEVLLKGLIISNQPFSIIQETYPNELSSHDLLNLFKLSKITVDDIEKPVLERLTASIEWVSKYPIPKKDSKFNPDLLSRNDGDFIVFEQMRNKILEKFLDEHN